MKRFLKRMLVCLFILGVIQITASASGYEELKIKSISIEPSTANLEAMYDGDLGTYTKINRTSGLNVEIEFESEVEYLDYYVLNADIVNLEIVELYAEEEMLKIGLGGGDYQYIKRSVNSKTLNLRLYQSFEYMGTKNMSGNIKEVRFYGRSKKMKPSLTLTDVNEAKDKEIFSTYININNAKNIYAEDQAC